MIKEKRFKKFTTSKVILECIKIGTQKTAYEVRDIFTDGVLYKGHTISYDGRKYVKTDNKGGKRYI
nr:hypothetical protein [uncultured Flavobacterium sp.]